MFDWYLPINTDEFSWVTSIKLWIYFLSVCWQHAVVKLFVCFNHYLHRKTYLNWQLPILVRWFLRCLRLFVPLAQHMHITDIIEIHITKKRVAVTSSSKSLIFKIFLFVDRKTSTIILNDYIPCIQLESFTLYLIRCYFYKFTYIRWRLETTNLDSLDL